MSFLLCQYISLYLLSISSLSFFLFSVLPKRWLWERLRLPTSSSKPRPKEGPESSLIWKPSLKKNTRKIQSQTKRKSVGLPLLVIWQTITCTFGKSIRILWCKRSLNLSHLLSRFQNRRARASREAKQEQLLGNITCRQGIQMKRDHHADSFLCGWIGKKRSLKRSGTVDPFMRGPAEYPGSLAAVPPPSLSIANQYLSPAQGMVGIETPPTRLPSIFTLLSNEETYTIPNSTHSDSPGVESVFYNLQTEHPPL